MNPVDEKKCSRCGETKPLSEFHENKRERDGRFADCKECRNAEARLRGATKRGEPDWHAAGSNGSLAVGKNVCHIAEQRNQFLTLGYSDDDFQRLTERFGTNRRLHPICLELIEKGILDIVEAVAFDAHCFKGKSARQVAGALGLKQDSVLQMSEKIHARLEAMLVANRMRYIEGMHEAIQNNIEIAKDRQHPRAMDALRAVLQHVDPPRGAKSELNINTAQGGVAKSEDRRTQVHVENLSTMSMEELMAKKAEIEASWRRDPPPGLEEPEDDDE